MFSIVKVLTTFKALPTTCMATTKSTAHLYSYTSHINTYTFKVERERGEGEGSLSRVKIRCKDDLYGPAAPARCNSTHTLASGCSWKLDEVVGKRWDVTARVLMLLSGDWCWHAWAFVPCTEAMPEGFAYMYVSYVWHSVHEGRENLLMACKSCLLPHSRSHTTLIVIQYIRDSPVHTSYSTYA